MSIGKPSWIFTFAWLIKASLGGYQWTLVPDPTIQNTYANVGRLRTETSFSLTHCAAECHVTAGCVSIGYGESTKMCYMYQTDLVHLKTADKQQTSDDIGYYKVTCNIDYLYLKELDTCIKIHDMKATWSDASTMCEADAAQLMTVKTQELLAALQELVFYDNQHYWLGGLFLPHALGGTTGEWQWQTGEVIDATTGGQLWLPGQPGSESCLIFQSSTSGQQGFLDRNCDKTQRFICQKNSI